MSNFDGFQTFQEKEVIILGAGIIGCATARILLQKGYKVTIVAKDLPGDTDIFYASNWAGAMWYGSGNIKNDYQKFMQTISFRIFSSDLLKDSNCGVCKVQTKELYEERPTSLWHTGVTPRFRQLESREFDNKEFSFGCEYENLVIEPARYLSYLKCEIEMLGGRFVRESIYSLEQLYEKFPGSIIFVNASGLGSKHIGGINDKKCFPNRGQNILVKADTNTLFTRNGEEYTYIIPRPLQGAVVCGGVNQENETSAEVDITIVEDEIKRTNKLAPQLIKKNPDILGYIIGIRPARKGGFRLEKEKVSQDKYILHLYGFDGTGYTYSYGAAHLVGQMVEEIEKKRLLGTSHRL